MGQLTRIEQLKVFLKDSPEDVFLQYALATEYVGSGKDLEAEQIFNHLIEQNPNYSPSYYHLGKLYERNEQSEKAIEIYEKGVEVCKKNKELKNLSEMQTALTNLMFDE